VHTVARICSAGHGGQILLSGAARDALGRSRPAGLRMRALGSHRFHGLREAVAIVQVMAPHLQARFPPLRTLAAMDTGETRGG
jgi:class 3 adenylate cyclase